MCSCGPVAISGIVVAFYTDMYWAGTHCSDLIFARGHYGPIPDYLLRFRSNRPSPP